MKRERLVEIVRENEDNPGLVDLILDEIEKARPSLADPVRAALEAVVKADLQIGDGHIEATRRTLHQAMDVLSVSTPTGKGEDRKLTILEVSECGGFKSPKLPIGMAAVTVRWNLSGEETVEYVSESALSLLNAAALAHPQQGGERDGWKLVPVEPTDAMCEAANKAWVTVPGCGEYNIYRAMIDAAPTSPSKSSGEEA